MNRTGFVRLWGRWQSFREAAVTESACPKFLVFYNSKPYSCLATRVSTLSHTGSFSSYSCCVMQWQLHICSLMEKIWPLTNQQSHLNHFTLWYKQAEVQAKHFMKETPVKNLAFQQESSSPSCGVLCCAVPRREERPKLAMHRLGRSARQRGVCAALGQGNGVWTF